MKPSRVTAVCHHSRAEEVWELGIVAGKCLHRFGVVHGIACVCQVVRQEGVVVGATVCPVACPQIRLLETAMAPGTRAKFMLC